jgi:hypothetical protein
MFSIITLLMFNIITLSFSLPTTQQQLFQQQSSNNNNNIIKINNGLGLTPPMGYSTWNDVGCNVTEKHVLKVAQMLHDSNLQNLGYKYVNIDDCWSEIQRDPITQQLIPNHVTFPSGIKSLADKLHKQGFKIGIYGDRGTLTCQRRPGSLGHEILDATTYASWGIDFLKQDSCYASPIDHDIAFKEYATMRDALNGTKRSIFFSLCGWFPFYAREGKLLGNSWRINADIISWNGVYATSRFMERLYQYSGPGGFNDPDLLLGSNPVGWLKLTRRQSRTQFSLWCVMGAPLLLSSVPNDPFDLETYGNAHAVSINQDPLVFPGRLCANTCPPHLLPSYESYRAVPPSNCVQVWYKKLSTGNVALVFVNWDPEKSLHVICSRSCLQRAGLGQYSLKELMEGLMLVYDEEKNSNKIRVDSMVVNITTTTQDGLGIRTRLLEPGESLFFEWKVMKNNFDLPRKQYDDNIQVIMDVVVE